MFNAIKKFDEAKKAAALNCDETPVPVMDEGHLSIGSLRVPIKDVRSISMLHEFDDKGQNGIVDVFLNVARRDGPRPVFGGRSTVRKYVGSTAAESEAAKYIRTKVRAARIPIVEL